MAKDNKFLKLLEKYQERFEQKGFLVGDVFKFNDNFKSHMNLTKHFQLM